MSWVACTQICQKYPFLTEFLYTPFPWALFADIVQQEYNKVHIVYHHVCNEFVLKYGFFKKTVLAPIIALQISKMNFVVRSTLSEGMYQ